ncbi:MucR family transcriptional regulator [Sphingobium sp. 15-1]|uniref:MucR family transcriptional regulator n=1 Tax=Sphingobium sp. 15-1 TaxID=2729616 RepID=UPI002100FB84|nr:MucR family transcriptional regulator [Sphingobium sp. 15-1]
MRRRTFLEDGSAIMADNNAPDITVLTVQLVSAFVSNNTVASGDLAGLIQSTRAALTNELNPTPAAPEAPTYTPAVSVRKSLSSPDHILSLIDGKPYKTLKRHLASHGLNPEEYRSRYNLPKSYPLVAASYSDARRAVASKIGLGRKPVTPAAPAVEAKPAAAAAPSAPAPAKAKVPAKPATPKKAVNGDAKAKSVKAAAPTAPAKAAPKAPAAAKTAPVADTKAAPAKAKAEPRKRLSIAAPKDEKPAAKVEAAAKPEVKAAAPKAKPAAAPKAAKPAAAAKKPEKAAKAVVNGDAKPKADTAPASA